MFRVIVMSLVGHLHSDRWLSTCRPRQTVVSVLTTRGRQISAPARGLSPHCACALSPSVTTVLERMDAAMCEKTGAYLSQQNQYSHSHEAQPYLTYGPLTHILRQVLLTPANLLSFGWYFSISPVSLISHSLLSEGSCVPCCNG